MFITESSLSVLGSSRSPEPDTRYSGVAGCELAIMENEINNYSLFKMHVASDAHEIGMIREGASEYEVHYFIEGTLSNLWEKIKEFIKKIWAKLKAILTGFIAKLEAFMGKNGYEFYKKYEKILHNGVHLKDVKTKYSKPKAEVTTLFSSGSTEIDLTDMLSKHYGITVSDADQKITKDVDMDDVKDEMLGKITGDKLKDYKTLKKDMKELLFEDEETEELEDGKISEYISFITQKKSVVDEFEKMRTKIDKQFTLWDKDIEKVRKHIESKIKENPSQGDTHAYNGLDASSLTQITKTTITYNSSTKVVASSRDKAEADTKYSQQTVNAVQQLVNAGSTVWGSAASSYMECCKFAVAQSRRIAAIIVAYRSRHKNESSVIDLSVPESDIYYQAIGEAAEWEVMSELEDNVPVYY